MAFKLAPITAEFTGFYNMSLMTFHYEVYFVHFCKRLKFDFFEICDLKWPHVTSRLLFFENRRLERHFDKQFIIFHQSPKFDLFENFWLQLTFYDLGTLFIRTLTSRASFLYTIYPLLIWHQTRNFFSRNNLQILLIILSYYLRKLM